MTTAAATERSHPSRVASPPARPTVLYDGRCRICVASSKKIRALDRDGAFDLLSLHEPEVARRFPEIEIASVLEEMHVVEPTGEVERGAEAVRAVLRRLPGLRWLGLFWLVPGFSGLAQVGYGFVARHRYMFNRNIQCDGNSCSVKSHRS